MATPTTNTVPVTEINPYGRGNVSALIEGTKWGAGPAGSSVTLTYSFPQDYAYYSGAYPDAEWSSWYGMTSSEQAAIRAGLQAFADVSNVAFVKVADTASVVGELRFALTDVAPPGTIAHGYYPSSNPAGGDVWMHRGEWHPSRTSAIPEGSYDYLTVLHEIGHALGLKHTFDRSATNTTVLPTSLDSYFYSVMSYSANPGGDNVASYYPTTLMYLDILAIQALYGKDTTTNAGDTVYDFYGGSRYFETIYDAGGTDTIRYTGSLGTKIVLSAGAFSSLSDPIFFGDGSQSRATVCIGPGVVIENAIGGNGNDQLLGNGAANGLSGRGGNDVLVGYAGNDALNGGAGADTMRGGAGNDIYFVDAAGDRVDEVTDGGAGADTVRSTISFSLGSAAIQGSVENLTLLGTGNINAAGNGLNNVLTGNGGANLLQGAGGNDRLTGGAGNDTFLFNTALNAATNIDTITDFNVVADTIQLENAIFKALAGLGVLSAAQFVANAAGVAADASDRIIYETDTGRLLYDANGSAAGGFTQFATLGAGLHLTNADFFIV